LKSTGVKAVKSSKNDYTALYSKKKEFFKSVVSYRHNIITGFQILVSMKYYKNWLLYVSVSAESPLRLRNCPTDLN
jgi:hypothetical protein